MTAGRRETGKYFCIRQSALGKITSGAIMEITRKAITGLKRRVGRKNCELESTLKRHKVFHAVNKTEETAVKAGYALSHLIASYSRLPVQKANL
jgi:hypothetical protein